MDIPEQEICAKSELALAQGGYEKWALRGSNPRPHGCDTEGAATDPKAEQSLTPTPSAACTSETKNANGMNLDTLAAELLALPKEERARILAKVLGEVNAG